VNRSTSSDFRIPLSPENFLWPRHGDWHTGEVSALKAVHSGPEAASLLVAIAAQPRGTF
jgi:hypothetical protein